MLAQDVSEFTHKLLDWLEEAFKLSDDLGTSGALITHRACRAGHLRFLWKAKTASAQLSL